MWEDAKCWSTAGPTNLILARGRCRLRRQVWAASAAVEILCAAGEARRDIHDAKNCLDLLLLLLRQEGAATSTG